MVKYFVEQPEALELKTSYKAVLMNPFGIDNLMHKQDPFLGAWE